MHTREFNQWCFVCLCNNFNYIYHHFSFHPVLETHSSTIYTAQTLFRLPLAFVGASDGWLDLLNVPIDEQTNSLLNKTTVAIITGITLVASQLKELAFIMSLAGATLGNALIYVYPTLMFCIAVKNMGEKASKGLKWEVPFAICSALLWVWRWGVLGQRWLSACFKQKCKKIQLYLGRHDELRILP